MTINNEKENGLTRRRFLKASSAVGIGGALAGISTVNNPKKGTAYAASWMVKEHDEFPYELNSDFAPFNTKNIAMYQSETDLKNWAYYTATHSMNAEGLGDTGRTQLEQALTVAAESGRQDFVSGTNFGGKSTIPYENDIYTWVGKVNEKKYEFSSPEEATKKVKRAATAFNMDLVGIVKYEDVEKYFFEGTPAKFPFKPKSVIIVALENDYDALKAAPTYIADVMVGKGYSQTALAVHQIAVFLRCLGYNAIASGDGDGLMIPMALHAGLGELSRIGIMITPEYGPRVTLAKVITDIELVPGKPITFGVQEFCKVCKKCAENCPAQTIPYDDEPTFETNGVVNIQGVKKWKIDGRDCAGYYGKIGGNCNVCRLVCPYNKLDVWQHDFAKIATVIPGVRTLAKSFDDIFGYGEPFNDQALENYWNM